MLNAWVKQAIAKGGGNQAEIARKMTERLSREIDRSIVQKISAGKRDISASEMIALSEISGLPIPGGAHPPPAEDAVDPATILKLMREAFQVFGLPPRQADFLAAAIVTVATSPTETQSLQSDSDFSDRFRALIAQSRRAIP